MSDYLSMEDLKTIAMPKVETISVTSLGGKLVKLRSLTALEVAKFFRANKQRVEAGKEEHHLAAFLAQAICHEDGTPFFDNMDHGMDALLSLPHAALLEMGEIATKLTPLSMEQLEERAKKSTAPATSNV